MKDLFETLDENTGSEGISNQVRKGYQGIAPWVLFASITGIISQIISFFVNFFDANENVVFNFIGLAIGLALNITLLQFGQEMTNFGKSGNVDNLETMFQKQYAYWIFLGILLILVLVLFFLALVALLLTYRP